MTNENTSPASSVQTEERSSSEQPVTATNVASSQGVDELDNIDFLLEEIENKIAPLALA